MKIAVIGAGGAGLTAAWLLEERHDVMVFERDERLGGHAQTLEVTEGNAVVHVSPGFHFFSRRMYPRFVALLEHLGVPLVDYEQTCTFYDRAAGSTVCLPPTGGRARLSTLFDLSALRGMLNLRKTLKAAEPLVADGRWSLTFGDFIGDLGLPPRFVSEFLLPFFASNWGVLTNEIATFAARAVLSYATLHQTAGLRAPLWTEIDGGIERYVAAIRHTSERARFFMGRAATIVRREQDAWTVETAGGAEGGFDHVIFASNARIAGGLLGNATGTDALRAILERFEYFQARVAVHHDPSFLAPNPRTWSIVNLSREPTFCAIHHYAGWRERVPVFRSWMTHYERRPRDLVAEFVYEHAKPTPAYYAAQSALAERQGRGGLWFTGVYTGGFDSHESAIGSAVDVARAIGAGTRLAVFEGAKVAH